MVAAVNAAGGALEGETDYSEAGANWVGTCKTGNRQSPIRIGKENLDPVPETVAPS